MANITVVMRKKFWLIKIASYVKNYPSTTDTVFMTSPASQEDGNSSPGFYLLNKTCISVIF